MGQSEKKNPILAVAADEKHLGTGHIPNLLTGAADAMIMNHDSSVGTIIFQNEPAGVAQDRRNLRVMLAGS